MRRASRPRPRAARGRSRARARACRRATDRRRSPRPAPRRWATDGPSTAPRGVPAPRRSAAPPSRAAGPGTRRRCGAPRRRGARPGRGPRRRAARAGAPPARRQAGWPRPRPWSARGYGACVQRRRLVRVPASTANLGPGFDAFAAALALHLEVDVVETGEFAVVTDLDVPRDRSNLLVRAFERLAPADGFEFRVSSDIPLVGGLGSSAAAIGAGLTAADHLFELDSDVLGLACELEGHPDNVAAAVHGGIVVVADGVPTRVDPPVALEAVLVVPGEAVTTTGARPALPQSVPVADAPLHAAHRAPLALGIATGGPPPQTPPAAPPPLTPTPGGGSARWATPLSAGASPRAPCPTAGTSRTARTCSRARRR